VSDTSIYYIGRLKSSEKRATNKMVTHKEIIVELKLPGLHRRYQLVRFCDDLMMTVGTLAQQRDIAKRKGGKLELGKFKSEFCYREGNDLLKLLLSLNRPSI